jgi:DNA modification methylase
VFDEVRRVLHPSGVCFVNCGDSYAGGGRGGNPDDSPFRKQATNAGSLVAPSAVPNGLKAKDRCLVPFRLALLLQSRGWWVRDVIAWTKPAPMPESARAHATTGTQRP